MMSVMIYNSLNYIKVVVLHYFGPTRSDDSNVSDPRTPKKGMLFEDESIPS